MSLFHVTEHTVKLRLSCLNFWSSCHPARWPEEHCQLAIYKEGKVGLGTSQFPGSIAGRCSELEGFTKKLLEMQVSAGHSEQYELCAYLIPSILHNVFCHFPSYAVFCC